MYASYTQTDIIVVRLSFLCKQRLLLLRKVLYIDCKLMEEWLHYFVCTKCMAESIMKLQMYVVNVFCTNSRYGPVNLVSS